MVVYPNPLQEKPAGDYYMWQDTALLWLCSGKEGYDLFSKCREVCP